MTKPQDDADSGGVEPDREPEARRRDEGRRRRIPEGLLMNPDEPEWSDDDDPDEAC